MRNIEFSSDRFYHVYNRGIEKRKIFLTKNDYYRFVQILYELNDKAPAIHLDRRSFLACIERAACAEQRKCLVSIVSFCLMPNHFHLLIQPRSNRALSEFMHRIGTSYAKYFNQKIERKGRLFESTFKAKEIPTDSYLLHLTRYIHLNPLSLLDPHWEERGIQNRPAAQNFLREYRWSSYPVYIGEKGMSFLLDHNTIEQTIGETGRSYEKFVLDWTERHLVDGTLLSEAKLRTDDTLYDLS